MKLLYCQFHQYTPELCPNEWLKTRIFEMHDKPGGLCTSWERKGYKFDGCIEMTSLGRHVLIYFEHGKRQSDLLKSMLMPKVVVALVSSGKDCHAIVGRKVLRHG